MIKFFILTQSSALGHIVATTTVTPGPYENLVNHPKLSVIINVGREASQVKTDPKSGKIET